MKQSGVDTKLMFELIGVKEYEKTLLALENQKLKEENKKLSTVEEKPDKIEG